MGVGPGRTAGGLVRGEPAGGVAVVRPGRGDDLPSCLSWQGTVASDHSMPMTPCLTCVFPYRPFSPQKRRRQELRESGVAVVGRRRMGKRPMFGLGRERRGIV